MNEEDDTSIFKPNVISAGRKEYLDERKDSNAALFVYDRKPYHRLKKSGIELIIKNITSRNSDIKTHVTPHIFRHTFATRCLESGMTPNTVSSLLGHGTIRMTLSYVHNSTENSEKIQRC